MLSAYEEERALNMKRNHEQLVALGLADGEFLAPRAPAPQRKRPRPKPIPQEPSRKSGRLAALPAPAVYIAGESASGQVTLGGADAGAAVRAAARSERVVEAAAAPDDEDEAPESADSLHDDEREVYEELRDEKNAIARELDTAAYHVSQNRALMSMVRRLPTTPAELVECWGWGETKASRHGERLLAVLEPHVDALRAERERRREAKDAEVIEVSDDDDDDAEEEEPLALRRERAAAAAESRRSGGGGGASSSSQVAATSRSAALKPSARSAWAAALRAMESNDDEGAAPPPPPPAAPAPAFLPLPETAEELLDHETPAFEALLAWKRARAKELGYNDPCIICHNRTLVELVRRLPASTAELQAVWGIGPKRVVQHGALMIAALAPFRAALLAARPSPRASSASVLDAARATEQKPRRASAAAWDEEAGAELAADAWRAQRDALGLPACDWAGRRRRCARVDGCAACAAYAADGEDFKYAVMSQRLLDVLRSPGAYGSAAAAHAAGWRWHASPNHGSNSHAHRWWPPQAAVDAVLGPDAKLPIGTYKALEVLEASV